MRLLTPLVALSGLASLAAGFATPPVEMLGLAPRGDAEVDPCGLANSPSVNASIQLSSWLECQVNGFFPYPANGAWDTVFARTFHPSLLATFNDTRYDYASWLQAYYSFNETLGRSFAPFRHGFLNVLAVPNANGDKGGMVYMIGWEGGYQPVLKRDLYYTDAAFAVVKDFGGRVGRRIVEFRESSNIPNTAPLPEPVPWGCKFDRRG
ncbi:hypothetical protein M011DRAFT_478436 [Sporormia fimetaria CBS 119925]|uniref:Uncharacterized protein n=1 Tax=Sporormia fimetaria CBS 119925 TaxID=1340428 RepID=A0A6A6V8I2_9PLEO|nr:hypothetical protein M011DRAFT_478436 [Sporormia fimetaria CBS 119925]